MRILHTIRSVDLRNGGPISGVLSLTQAYAERGQEMEIVSLDYPDDEWVRACPVKVHALGWQRAKYGWSPRYVRWACENIPRFDIVVVNGLWLFNGFGTWLALRKSRVPYYVFPHGMLDPWFKRRYWLKHAKKCLYWWAAERRVLRDAEAVLFTTEEERRLARDTFSPYSCRELVVGYGVPPPPGERNEQIQAFHQAFPGLEKARFWLFLGRLHEKKGCDLLLRAFAMLARDRPEICLVMAGPDQEGSLARYKKLATELGLDGRVIWTGMLRGKEKWGAYRAAEVFILPSHQENFGLAVAEALACETPVLISNKVNIWREVSACNGGLVANDDLAGTESLLKRWMELPEPGRWAMRRRALACFANNFHVDSFAGRLHEVFKNGVDHSRRSGLA
jgi:glycosyltransferase involved in cell wall biosynthesis